MKLKNGYKLVFGEYEYDNDPTCGKGSSRQVWVKDSTGSVVWSGITCPCGRGCGNKDCVCDDWGYHDTDIEQYRE